MSFISNLKNCAALKVKSEKKYFHLVNKLNQSLINAPYEIKQEKVKRFNLARLSEGTNENSKVGKTVGYFIKKIIVPIIQSLDKT